RQDPRDVRAGRPVHRRPNRDSGSARPRAQAVSQRQAYAERHHQAVHLRRPLSRELPLQSDDALPWRPHRDRYSARRGFRAEAAGLPAARRHVPTGDHRPRADRERGEGSVIDREPPMLDVIAPLVVPNTTKIVLVSLDGLGGLPRPETGRSELETAHLPNLSQLATDAACGLVRHVAPGITPGSGPGHLGLFGYDPLHYQVGRGVLEALGIEFDLRAGDLAARGNFCTVDASGRITDRRAGRLATDINLKLTERLRRIKLPGVEVFVESVKEHRFVLVLRARARSGARLAAGLSETDPQATGQPPLPVKALHPRAKATAALVNRFVAEARRLLADAAPANMVPLRGFAQFPQRPRFPEVFGLRSAAIAAYPMYR